MYIVDITGGIGVGKSVISNIFFQKGIPVYNTDLSAKLLMSQIYPLKKNIINFFGKDSYLSGELNRKYLSQKVFKNPFLLKYLNALVHPWVLLDFKKWMTYHNNSPYCIKESAILFESGTYIYSNVIITVISPLEKRIKRIIERDKINLSEILRRMRVQYSDKEKIKYSDIIIKNTKNIEYLYEIVEEIHKKILKKYYYKINHII